MGIRRPNSVTAAATVVLVAVAAGALLAGATAAGAQSSDAYRPPAQYGNDSVYRPVQQAPSGYDGSAGGASPGSDGVYRPRGGDTYRQGDAYSPRGGDPYSTERGGYSPGGGGQYGEPYSPPREPRGERYESDRYRDDGRGGYADGGPGRGAYTQNEILGAGHRFFGKVSQGFANVIEYVFQKSGRPNGYILGEDAGGAFVAGLRYGEGRLYTKDAGEHPVYWQGPSLGYDFGADGSKTMVLVYNLRDPSEIYERFGGVQGSAYLVGGVSVHFQKHGDVVLAPIRSGVGLRLGANVGYLKYTRQPTWNPF